MGLLLFILMLGVSGLSLDITNALRIETMLQATADAAAHGAVQDLPNESATVASALKYANLNMPFAEHGSILQTADIRIGVWEPDTRTLRVESGEPPNAVLVTLRRVAANGNAVGTNFLRIAGLNEWDITAEAIAMIGVHPCLANGFVAAGRISTGSTNDYVDLLCIHGQLGVKIGSANTFEPGVGVTMLDLSTFEQHQQNDGIELALGERNFIPPLPTQLPALYSGLVEGSLAWPDYILSGPVNVQYLPDDPSPNTFYIVQEAVNFRSSAHLENLMVLGMQEIQIGSNSTLSNVFLFSMDNISIGSNNLIGSRTYCEGGEGSVKLFAAGDVKLGVNTEYSGVQIVSTNNVQLGSNLVSLVGISVQAGADIVWGSAQTFGGCGAPTDYNPKNSVYIVN